MTRPQALAPLPSPQVLQLLSTFLPTLETILYSQARQLVSLLSMVQLLQSTRVGYLEVEIGSTCPQTILKCCFWIPQTLFSGRAGYCGGDFGEGLVENVKSAWPHVEMGTVLWPFLVSFVFTDGTCARPVGKVGGEVKLSISYKNNKLFIMVMYIRDLVSETQLCLLHLSSGIVLRILSGEQTIEVYCGSIWSLPPSWFCGITRQY